MGQNFLIDTNISRKITKLVQGQLADPIIEIGPGTGSLTNELLKDNYRIKAVEVDKAASDVLLERFSGIPNIEIYNETFTGKKNFTAFTMDLTKKYIEINADYRS